MLWVGEGKEWNRNVGLMEEGLMAVRNKVGRGVGFVGIYVCWCICGFLVLGTSAPAGCRHVPSRRGPRIPRPRGIVVAPPGTLGVGETGQFKCHF